MAVQEVVDAAAQCPPYCAVNHEAGISSHGQFIAEMVLPGERVSVAVYVVRGKRSDLVELVSQEEEAEPTVAHLIVEEARALRAALDTALTLLGAA